MNINTIVRIEIQKQIDRRFIVRNGGEVTLLCPDVSFGPLPDDVVANVIDHAGNRRAVRMVRWDMDNGKVGYAPKGIVPLVQTGPGGDYLVNYIPEPKPTVGLGKRIKRLLPIGATLAAGIALGVLLF